MYSHLLGLMDVLVGAITKRKTLNTYIPSTEKTATLTPLAWRE